MFSKTAAYYDRLYSFKNYRAETDQLIEILRPYQRSKGRRLLDAACGTGRHLEYLREHFDVEGLDLEDGLLELARQRNPGVPLVHADMADFHLGRTFDVITCLFSSIGYLKTLERVAAALGCMAQHLVPGGVLALEPWFTPGEWIPGSVHALLVDEPELKIARVSTSFVDGRISYFDLHYLIGTPQGTEHVVERHELGLFEIEEMREVIEGAGLRAVYDPVGLIGRGLWLGCKPE